MLDNLSNVLYSNINLPNMVDSKVVNRMLKEFIIQYPWTSTAFLMFFLWLLPKLYFWISKKIDDIKTAKRIEKNAPKILLPPREVEYIGFDMSMQHYYDRK